MTEKEIREYLDRLIAAYLIYKVGQMIFWKGYKNNGKHENL